MARYYAGPPPSAWWDDEHPLLPSLDVPDHLPHDTGLVDVEGYTIWRAPRPIGFGRDAEW